MIRNLMSVNDFNNIADEFAKMEKHLSKVFSDDGGLWRNYGSNFPKFNIYEIEKGFVCEAGVAGFKKEEIKVEVDGDYIKIKGEKNSNDENKKYHLKELTTKNFEKSIYLPSTIDKEKIKVSYEDGILSINIPKNEKEINKKRTLAIE